MIEIRQLQKNYQDFHLDCSLRVEDGMNHRISREKWCREEYDI